MFSAINPDTILSDPMLLVGAILFVLGPLVFLFSLIKYFTTKGPRQFAIPDEPTAEPADAPASAPQDISEAPSPEHQDAADEPPPEHAPSSDKTVVIPAAQAELQSQIEIAITQIRSLHKKMMELDQSVESLERHQSVQLEENDLKSVPANPEDFNKKLLKLAEHVIVLEKEVARLRSFPLEKTSSHAAPSPSTPPHPAPGKPPIMPL